MINVPDLKARFQFATEYKNPNACVGCGKTDNGNLGGPGMVDLGREIEWYGVVYVCQDCAYEIAHVFGAKSPAQLEEQTRALDEALSDNARLRAENLALKKVTDGYNEYGSLVAGTFTANLRASFNDAEDSDEPDSDTGSVEPSEVIEDSENTDSTNGDSISEDTDRESESGNAEADESSDKPRSDDVSTNSGDFDFGIFDDEPDLHSDGD